MISKIIAETTGLSFCRSSAVNFYNFKENVEKFLIS